MLSCIGTYRRQWDLWFLSSSPIYVGRRVHCAKNRSRPALMCVTCLKYRQVEEGCSRYALECTRSFLAKVSVSDLSLMKAEAIPGKEGRLDCSESKESVGLDSFCLQIRWCCGVPPGILVESFLESEEQSQFEEPRLEDQKNVMYNIIRWEVRSGSSGTEFLLLSNSIFEALKII
jgi:hypothetical protein